MDSPDEAHRRLEQFVATSAFARRGAVMTDLDGTAVHEDAAGRIRLEPAMALGLQAVHATGRPVVVNTLRFPLSVIRVFAAEWVRAGGGDLPLVSLRGGQIGRIVRSRSGEPWFEELGAFPLGTDELTELLDGIRGMVAQGVADLLVFFYPRDWRQGERIWCATAERVRPAAAKYRSASDVFSGGVPALEGALLHSEPCMVILLVDAPDDRQMAYQHTQRTRFANHVGVSKRHGAQAIASAMEFSLADSLGAGDAETDDFLAAVGFATIVGNVDIAYKGLAATVRLADSASFGALLLTLAHALR